MWCEKMPGATARRNHTNGHGEWQTSNTSMLTAERASKCVARSRRERSSLRQLERREVAWEKIDTYTISPTTNMKH